MIKLRIERTLKSYDFRENPNAPDSFANNWKNNSRDWLVLLDDKAEICRFRCQTVANYCFGKMAPGDTVEHGDTIAPGQFQVRLFAEPRAFHGEIHEIIEATDIDGQRIDGHAMQTTADGFQSGRWLIHDRYSFKLKKDTNYAWSAGCFILASGDLEALNHVLHAYKFMPGEIIAGEVIEVDY